jgi:UDP-N-acetylglucosamine:LPS N-acetylglucosamine transferase
MMSATDCRICLISSHGGHLRELLDATSSVAGDKYYVTCRTAHTQELLADERAFFVIDPHLSLIKYLLNALQSLFILLRRWPQVIVSTGAGIALPTLLFGKYLCRAKIIYIESAANVVHPSRTGKMMYRYADLFLLQWESQQEFYPDGILVGLQ